jgi:hypothetical protein
VSEIGARWVTSRRDEVRAELLQREPKPMKLDRIIDTIIWATFDHPPVPTTPGCTQHW